MVHLPCEAWFKTFSFPYLFSIFLITAVLFSNNSIIKSREKLVLENAIFAEISPGI